MEKITTEFLARVPLFRQLSTEQLNLITTKIERKHYSKNGIIFADGEQADKFFIVYMGQVKIFKLAEDGKVQILNIFGSGDVFGEVPMFADSNFPAHCEATKDSEILSISRQALFAMMESDPTIAINIITLFAQRLKNFTKTIENLTLKDVTARLAAYLLQISNLRGGADNFELDTSKTLTANLLGTSRETLSRTLKKLIDQGLITVAGKKVNLLNIPGLEKLAAI